LRIDEDIKSSEFYKKVNSNNIKKEENSTGQHEDLYCSLFHFPSYYFLSWLIYILLLQSFYSRFEKLLVDNSNENLEHRNYLVLLLLGAHVMIWLFGMMSRSIQRIFLVRSFFISFPIIDKYILPVHSAFLINTPIVILIFLINFFYFKRRLKIVYG